MTKDANPKPALIEEKTIDEYLKLYEQRRMEYENMCTLDYIDGGDPLTAKLIRRAIRRMSYDYQKLERELKRKHSSMNTIKKNISQFEFGQVV